MERIIKKVLNHIEKNGFEAFVVGGYVRDLLIGKTAWDVDICTNALPKDLIYLFPNAKVGVYGGIGFKVGKYSFEITTYRKEYNYHDRKPSKVEYINNLFEDIKRRDFTINTICMNQKGNIIDILDGQKDLHNHTIKMVGNIKEKIIEDPLRILRALRLATCLNFDLDKSLALKISENSFLITTLSDYRIIEEITKILINDNCIKGLKLLDNLGILDELGISCENVVRVNDINGMWAQLNMKKTLAFNKETLHNIDVIKKIIKRKKIGVEELFEFGLYFCLIAGEIMKIDKKNIYSIYKKMPIKSIKDIAVSSERIIDYLSLKPGEQIGKVIEDLRKEILYGNLPNKSKYIYKYLNKYYKGVAHNE